MRSRSTLNILLAEDNPISQKMAQIVLRKLGMKADLAKNGLEVLTALEERSYDLVLMDIQMPEMDGIEATRVIRKRWPQGPKIIVITSLEQDLIGDLCHDAGADDLIRKPYRMDELDAAIERSLASGSIAMPHAQALLT
jgi:CheY-like chemotaxis protein